MVSMCYTYNGTIAIRLFLIQQRLSGMTESHNQAGLEAWGVGGRINQPWRAGVKPSVPPDRISPLTSRSGNQKRARLGGSGY
jgi:hypothetical protein